MDGKLRNMTSVYLTGEQGILCLFRIGSRVANNKYVGAAGGHFEPDELNDAKKCVLREMQEELGLAEEDVADMKLRYITLRLKNGEIRQNYYFFGKLLSEKPLQSTEGNLRWFTYEEAEYLQMPASAKHMMLHYLKVGRFDDHLYAGITENGETRFVIMKDFED
ncbi:MAG: NUDIX domain-containing protein [Oscillospiraceae bacterium]|nr:NUDIX domain-containing protein [Oscillospiraceae bacterium]